MFSIKVAANPILEGHLEISVTPLETLSEYKSPDPAVERGSELKSTGTLIRYFYILLHRINLTY